MPAQSGRVKRPANNRLSVSTSLNTTDIWKNSVGYDPYSGENETKFGDPIHQMNTEEAHKNRRAGVMALARLTGADTDRLPGACKHCGHVGHLPQQCFNMFKLDIEEDLSRAVESDSEHSEPQELAPELKHLISQSEYFKTFTTTDSRHSSSQQNETTDRYGRSIRRKDEKEEYCREWDRDKISTLHDNVPTPSSKNHQYQQNTRDINNNSRYSSSRGYKKDEYPTRDNDDNPRGYSRRDKDTEIERENVCRRHRSSNRRYLSDSDSDDRKKISNISRRSRDGHTVGTSSRRRYNSRSRSRSR